MLRSASRTIGGQPKPTKKLLAERRRREGIRAHKEKKQQNRRTTENKWQPPDSAPTNTTRKNPGLNQEHALKRAAKKILATIAAPARTTNTLIAQHRQMAGQLDPTKFTCNVHYLDYQTYTTSRGNE